MKTPGKFSKKVLVDYSEYSSLLDLKRGSTYDLRDKLVKNQELLNAVVKDKSAFPRDKIYNNKKISARDQVALDSYAIRNRNREREESLKRKEDEKKHGLENITEMMKKITIDGPRLPVEEKSATEGPTIPAEEKSDDEMRSEDEEDDEDDSKSNEDVVSPKKKKVRGKNKDYTKELGKSIPETNRVTRAATVRSNQQGSGNRGWYRMPFL